MNLIQRVAPVAVALATVLVASACTGSSAASGPHSNGASGPTPATGSPSSTGPAVPAPPAGKMTPGVPSSGDAQAAAEGDQSSVLLSLPGASSTTSCLAVGTHTVVHSGQVAAGDFAAARTAYAKTKASPQTPTVPLYVIPQRVKKLKRVSLTITPATGGAAHTVTSTEPQPADVWTYYNLQVPVAAPGTYRVAVVAGQDRGCFIVQFAR